MSQQPYILGIDIGYGDVKVVIGTPSQITHQFKFSSAIAQAGRASAIRDARIIELDVGGELHQVYAGTDALALPSNQIVDISDYDTLEAYAPVFIYKALKTADINPELIKVLVSGLSVSQLGQSGYFKERIRKFEINGESFNFDQVFLLPQGAGSKMAFDKFGANYPQPRTTSATNTFVGCDIGFNTLDLFYVTDGKTSPNLFEGIPQEGVMRIANMVRENIKEQFQRDITLREAKQVLDTKVYKLRGERHNMSAAVDKAIAEYVQRLQEIIEEKYGPIIDKCDFICLQGGGAMFFNLADPFFQVVKNSSEFYNAIGFYLYGCQKVGV